MRCGGGAPLLHLTSVAKADGSRLKECTPKCLRLGGKSNHGIDREAVHVPNILIHVSRCQPNDQRDKSPQSRRGSLMDCMILLIRREYGVQRGKDEKNRDREGVPRRTILFLSHRSAWAGIRDPAADGGGASGRVVVCSFPWPVVGCRRGSTVENTDDGEVEGRKDGDHRVSACHFWAKTTDRTVGSDRGQHCSR